MTKPSIWYADGSPATLEGSPVVTWYKAALDLLQNPRVDIVVACRHYRRPGSTGGWCGVRVVDGTERCARHQPEQPGD